MQIGQKVVVTRESGSWLFEATWWPVCGISGTVTRICKNGAVYVAVDQFANQSIDNKMTYIFRKSDLVTFS